MRTKKWYYESQRLFSLFLKQNDLYGECIEQKITPYTLYEKWFARISTKPSPFAIIELRAFKKHDRGLCGKSIWPTDLLKGRTTQAIRFFI